MDTVISNVLLFLQDSGLYATLEALSLELEALKLNSPDTKSTIGDLRIKPPMLNFGSREKLHVLTNNRNLDANSYPHLYNLVRLAKRDDFNVTNNSGIDKPILTRQLKTQSFKIQNKGINNLVANLNDAHSPNDFKKSRNSNKNDCNFSFQVTPSKSQSNMVLEPSDKKMVSSKEYRNIQSLGNLQKISYKNSRSNIDVFSADYDSEIGEIDSMSHKDSRDFQPFFVNEGILKSDTEVWSGEI